MKVTLSVVYDRDGYVSVPLKSAELATLDMYIVKHFRDSKGIKKTYAAVIEEACLTDCYCPQGRVVITYQNRPSGKVHFLPVFYQGDLLPSSDTFEEIRSRCEQYAFVYDQMKQYVWDRYQLSSFVCPSLFYGWLDSKIKTGDYLEKRRLIWQSIKPLLEEKLPINLSPSLEEETVSETAPFSPLDGIDLRLSSLASRERDIRERDQPEQAEELADLRLKRACLAYYGDAFQSGYLPEGIGLDELASFGLVGDQGPLIPFGEEVKEELPAQYNKVRA